MNVLDTYVYFLNFRALKGLRPDVKAIAGSPRKCQYKDPLDLHELENLVSKKYAESSEKKVRWAVKNYANWRLHAMKSDNFDHHLVDADVHDGKSLDKTCFALPSASL